MDQSSAPTFSIILKTVPADSDQRSEFLDAFSDKFHLPRQLSRNILECAPVALFRELNRGQVSDVKPSLKSLSETYDTQFFITSSSVSALPALNWPEHPDFDAVEPDQTFSEVEITRRNDAVVCPECEHILVLDTSGERTTARKLVNVPSSDTSEERGDVRDDDSFKNEREPEAIEELDDDLEKEVEEEIEEELEELLDNGQLSASESASSASSTADEASEAETPVRDGSDADRDTAEPNTRSTGGSSTDSSPQTSNGRANVFLSGEPDADTDEILELLSAVRDCSTSEAENLMDRPITPIKNGVSEEEAKELQERFNEIGVAVNIVHK